jgi:hypothetical protein
VAKTDLDRSVEAGLAVSGEAFVESCKNEASRPYFILVVCSKRCLHYIPRAFSRRQIQSNVMHCNLTARKPISLPTIWRHRNVLKSSKRRAVVDLATALSFCTVAEAHSIPKFALAKAMIYRTDCRIEPHIREQGPWR